MPSDTTDVVERSAATMARLVDQAVHVHDAEELTWVAAGSSTIVIDSRRWVVDAEHALVIPAGVSHTVLPRPDSLVFPLIFAEGLLGAEHPVRVARSRELDACVHVLLQPGLATPEATTAARLRVRDLVRRSQAPDAPRMPTDARAREVASTLLDQPANPLGLEDWARRVHTSSKTLQRCFLRDTGLTFPEWRSAARLTQARQLLERGDSVGAVARTVGYSSASAFISAYRRRYLSTPGSVRVTG